MPEDTSIKGLVTFIHNNMSNEALVQACSVQLSHMVNYEEFDLKVKHNKDALLDLMMTYASNSEIQQSVLSIIETSLNAVVKTLFQEAASNENSPKTEFNHLNTKFIETFFYIFLVGYLTLIYFEISLF